MANLKKYELKKIQTDFPNQIIDSSYSAQEFIRNFYSDDIEVFESFFILLLNRANKTIGYAKISQGGICSTVVDVRIIAKYVVESLATGVILAHNHPSGNKTPSNEDIKLTEKIKQCLSFFDVNVLDHIILTDNNYYSFADDSKL